MSKEFNVKEQFEQHAKALQELVNTHNEYQKAIQELTFKIAGEQAVLENLRPYLVEEKPEEAPITETVQ